MNCQTGKKRHSSESQAKRFRMAYNNGRKVRVYYCDVCQGWHLTTEDAPFVKAVTPYKRKRGAGYAEEE